MNARQRPVLGPILLPILLVLVGCDDDTPAIDAVDASAATDAGRDGGADATAGSLDATPPLADATAVDASTDATPADASTDATSADARSDAMAADAAPPDPDAAPPLQDVGPPHPDAAPPPAGPVAVFGDKYWNVYRPHFFARFYEDGRVTDRIELGLKMFGDNTLFMGYALSTFVFEHQAWPTEEARAVIHRILQGFDELDRLDGDPLDGYMYRSDRGPDYEGNLLTRDNEPSGDQYLSVLRGLRDVVRHPGPLEHAGVDLKRLARERAALLGNYLRAMRFRMRNRAGQYVRRGDDQRWASWAFQQGAGQITGLGRDAFTTSWTVNLGVEVAIDPQLHRAIAHQFLWGCVAFTRACVGGRAIDLGIGAEVQIDCNEFNIGLGGDGAIISLSDDPASPDWFSAVINRDDLVAEGNALYALYAHLQFNDDDPALVETAGRFRTAPARPPTGQNLDPNGWCVSWRWARDFDDPDRCAGIPHPGAEFSGLDYMFARALASAYGAFPEE